MEGGGGSDAFACLLRMLLVGSGWGARDDNGASSGRAAVSVDNAGRAAIFSLVFRAETHPLLAPSSVVFGVSWLLLWYLASVFVLGDYT